MNCKQARDLFSASLDKDLTFDEQSQMDQHLAGCNDCSTEMEKFSGICSFLRTMPETDPGEGFLAQIQQKIRTTDPVREPMTEPGGLSWVDSIREFFAIGWVRPALGGALGLVVGLLINLGGTTGNTGSTLMPSIVENDTHNATHLVVDDYFRHQSDSSPFAEIDLPPLDSATDTPEYVLDPYIQDPARGLVLLGNSDVHQVNADGNMQRGVKIYR